MTQPVRHHQPSSTTTELPSKSPDVSCWPTSLRQSFCSPSSHPSLCVGQSIIDSHKTQGVLHLPFRVILGPAPRRLVVAILGFTRYHATTHRTSYVGLFADILRPPSQAFGVKVCAAKVVTCGVWVCWDFFRADMAGSVSVSLRRTSLASAVDQVV